MKKETIYIDIEDDITTIIGKVKAAEEKIVALVPPKRIGVLQSAVNLQLLKRAAEQGKKHLVLITNDAVLTGLAASLRVPIAKNLQSKPEVPEISTLDIDNGEEIIDGSKLPVGELMRTDDTPDKAVASSAAATAGTSAAPKPSKSATAKNKPKVPNFNMLRKRLVLVGAAAALLIGFFVWAIFFAPRATVTIQASTSEESINQMVSMTADGKVDLEKGTLPLIEKTAEEDISLTITPTGKKDVGERATGTVQFVRDASNSLTIPAGTELTSSSGEVFALDAAVTIPRSAAFTEPGCSSFPTCPGSATGSVTATERGTDSNGAAGSLSGAPSGVSANLTAATSGGTDKEVEVITQSDLDKALDEVGGDDGDATKKAELMSEFGEESIVIENSFVVDRGEVKPSPALGEEVTGEAKLTGKVTYSLRGVSKASISEFLDAYFNKSISELPNQRIYDNGASDARFTSITGKDDAWKGILIATAQIGPNIDDEQVKEIAKGKKFGEIQAALEGISGVERADTTFWPFWVRTVPNNSEKITVEFQVDGTE